MSLFSVNLNDIYLLARKTNICSIFKGINLQQLKQIFVCTFFIVRQCSILEQMEGSQMSTTFTYATIHLIRDVKHVKIVLCKNSVREL